MRATEEENGNFLGEQHAPRDSLRGARPLPTSLSYSVALKSFSVSSVVKKAQWSSVVKKVQWSSVVKKVRVRLRSQTMTRSTCGSFGVTTRVLPST